MKNFFIFGYYGFRNTGDEAILQTIINQIRKAIPKAEITALTYKAKETSERFGINAISRNDFRELIRAIGSSDAVISGGGSILQDATSNRSLLYYLAIIYIAKKFGKKVMFYGNGFGPITNSLNKKLAKLIINEVDAITVRDHYSKEFMQSLGIKKNITVTADVVFAMEKPSEESTNVLLEKEALSLDKPLIGISIRKWKGQENYKSIIAKTADYLVKRNFQVVFIPMQYPDDYVISSEIIGMMDTSAKVIEEQYSPQQVLGLIGKLHLLIGMRLHSLVFAAIASIPMIGIEYEDKVKSFLKLVNQKSGGRAENLDMIHLWTMIDEVLQNKAKYQKELIDISKNMINKSNMNIEIFKEFVEEGGIH